jgi:predicted TIM-barrel fold metal-dependent hydrolase
LLLALHSRDFKQNSGRNLATQANNDLAALISNNTMRFGAFAALSLHNASQAGIELRRAVTKLDLSGALVNDYQQSGDDNDIPQLATLCVEYKS